MGPKMAVFWENGGQSLDFGFATPKRHFLARNHVVWRILREIGARVSAVAFLKNQKKLPSHFLPRGAKSRMRRTETPRPIWITFCVVVDIPYAVKYTNFGDHRLRGFRVAGGQISPSPIYFHRRPYNTLALQCERVIWYSGVKWVS